MSTPPKFTSLVDMFEKSCQTYASRDLFGFKKDGAWQWVSYAETRRRVDLARAGLAALGVARGDRVAIIANNRVEWAVMAYATYGLGGAYVPMYEAQHMEEWAFILADCEAKVLVAATRAIYEKVKGLPAEIPTLKHVICLEGSEEDPATYAHLLAEGKKSPVPATEPEGKDTAGLIYTSGTTGKPKGVLLSHSNFALNVSSIHEIFPLAQEDRSLSFLPWAHSFGQTCELHAMLSMGASMALNTAVDKLIDELSEVKPTVLFSVPRIFNRLYDVINKQMAERPAPIRNLFQDALRISARKRDGQHVGLRDSIKYAIANKVIFTKVRAKLGGQLKYAFSGGAALSKNVAEFIDGIGIMVYEGYGLTETSPIATANCPNSRKIGSVGKAIPGVKIVIDKAATGEDKHGEVLVYGHNVMQGYHNRPEENAQVLMPDGGFRTGDMGFVDPDGFLFITGRIKEQYKLENGKYVVPSPLEEELKLSPFIINAMVHGANRPFNVALIVPDRDTVTKFAQAEGISGDYDGLLKNDRVKAKIGEELEKYSAAFRAFDKVKKFALIPEDFTTQNDMLTPSMKLKRRNVLKKWEGEIDRLYALASPSAAPPMLPSLESLRCFASAARLLNFRNAARAVALTPAAFGQRIRQLEEQLGAQLFHRTTRAVSLTQAGLSLLPFAERCLLAAGECVRAARGETGPPPMEITLGTRHELGMSWVVSQLDPLSRVLPSLQLHLYFGSGPDLLLRVRTMEIDCAVTSSRFTDPKLDAVALHREDYAFVGAASLLARKPLTRPDHAADHTLLDVSAELPLFRYFRDASPIGDRLRFGRIVRLGGIEAIRRRVAEGAGVAVLPAYLVKADLRARKLRAILPRTPPGHDFFRLVFRADDPRRSVYDALATEMLKTPLR
jgi:long-chain acyl-CoA synthetase